MFKILIFGGTTEGRMLAEFCDKNDIEAAVSVTTDRGVELLPRSKNIKILNSKLDAPAIERLMVREKFSLIVDATHPYAFEVTENINSVCERLGVAHFRLVRDMLPSYSDNVFGSVSKLVEFLNENDFANKMILSVLGSRQFSSLTALKNFQERLFIRVLPDENFVDSCVQLGLPRNHILTGIGPFSVEQNCEHIRSCGAEILLTKESGAAGGYLEKIEAAKICGIPVFSVKPPKESGKTFDEIVQIIKNGGVL